MMKQYALWYKGIAVNSAALGLVAMILLSSGSAFAQAADPDPKQAATTSANTVNQKFGSTSGITSNFTTPLSGGGQMSTISGATTFDSKISCPSSTKFLSVTILPSTTGDITTLLVQQDTNVDGTVDYSYSAPVRVSGICADGIISCDAGTWNNCAYYKWTADGSSKASMATATNITALSSCYCINNSCGVNLATMKLNVILKDLGMGVVNVVQGTNPQFTVSSVDVVDTTISYYGQQSTNCTSASTGMQNSPGNATQYFGDPSTMSGNAQGIVTTQLADPTSYYSALTSASNSAGSQGSYNQCTVKNVAVVNTDKQTPSYTWQPWIDVAVTCYFGRDSVNGCSISIPVDTNRDGIYDATDSYSKGCCWTNSESINVVGRPVAASYVSAEQAKYGISSSEIQQTVNSEVWWRTDGGGKGNHGDVTYYEIKWDRVSEPVCPTGYTYNAVDLKCYLETLNDSVVNNCTAFETDANCTLKTEVADGVQTYNNFNPTGLSPSPSCKTVTGAMQSFTVCHDWWEKDRSYFCKTAGAYDFSDAKKRMASIYTSAKDNSSTLDFTDTRKDASGNWLTEAGTIALSDRDASSCPQSCKVKKPSTNTQAGSSGNATQFQTSNTAYDFVLKQCNSSGCPVGADEIIVKDCQCITDFVEAATAMSVVDQAGKDLICSDGTKQ